MNDSDFEKLKNVVIEFSNNVASVVKALADVFMEANGEMEKFFEIMRANSKKDRHRRSYYRMMERRRAK